MRKIPCTLVMVWLFYAVSFTTSLPGADRMEVSNFSEDYYFPEDEIRFRIQLMRSPVSPVYDKDVEAYLRSYLTYGARDTEKMLGRGTLMFPVFEQYLEAYDLPVQLKFLPVIESSLIPQALSTRGAAGLWQLMPATARHLDLTVDQHLDERRDLYKSTEAAVKYLKKLYDRFGEWELALAAYNCGPGRVSQAIGQVGSSSFQKVKHLLPLQTQRYIARFLAASYTGVYYELHGLVPDTTNISGSEDMAIRVYDALNLYQVAKITGLEVSHLRRLNPAFKRNYLPARKSGTFLVMPKKAWYAYLDATEVARP